MSLTSESDTAIPEETVALKVRVIFTKGNPYVKMMKGADCLKMRHLRELFSQRASAAKPQGG